jgi:hypothetical protein
MNTLKIILYPYIAGFAALALAMLLGTAAFGADISNWARWQHELVSTCGTLLGIVGAVLGLWSAMQPTRQAKQ